MRIRNKHWNILCNMPKIYVDRMISYPSRSITSKIMKDSAKNSVACVLERVKEWMS